MESNDTYVGEPALRSILTRHENCGKCAAVCAHRNQSGGAIIIGQGNYANRLLFVSMHPGDDDARVGQFLHGSAGRHFLSLAAHALPDPTMRTSAKRLAARDARKEYPRHTYVRDALLNPDTGLGFWTSILACPTPDGRAPSASEVKNCVQRVHQTIYAVDPLLIIAFGKAAGSIIGKSIDPANFAGRTIEVDVKSPVTGAFVRYGIFVMPDIGHTARIGDEHLMTQKRGEAYKMVDLLSKAFNMYYELSGR